MFGRVMAAYESVRREGESTESSSHVFEKCSREKNLPKTLTACASADFRAETRDFVERAVELRLFKEREIELLIRGRELGSR